MAFYINQWGEREDAWYEVKRYLKGSNGYDCNTTFHNTLKQAKRAKKQAEQTGKYEAVFIDFVAADSGIIDN